MEQSTSGSPIHDLNDSIKDDLSFNLDDKMLRISLLAMAT